MAPVPHRALSPVASPPSLVSALRIAPADDGAVALCEPVKRNASGELACNERNDERQIALWKTGVTL